MRESILHYIHVPYSNNYISQLLPVCMNKMQEGLTISPAAAEIFYTLSRPAAGKIWREVLNSRCGVYMFLNL